MNAFTAILLSVLVHLGGVDLDTTRDASLQWYRESDLTGQWELEATRSGAYRFVSDDGLVIIERLREADMTYAVQQYETIKRETEQTTGPIPRTLRSLGAVSLRPEAQNLQQPRSSRGALSIDAARVPVAWSQVPPSTPGEVADFSTDENLADEPASEGDATGDSVPAGGISVAIGPGWWSATHTASGQVMVLQVR